METVDGATSIYPFQGSAAYPVFYDAYGQPVWQPPTQNTFPAVLNRATAQPFQYKGQYGYYTDGATGLSYCLNRYYDSLVGRWTSHDPTGLDGGVNVYQYVDGDPVEGVDPSGLVIIKIISYAVAGTSGVWGWHRGIIVEDNVGHTTTYSFAGGPERYGYPHSGMLISRSGPWKPPKPGTHGTQDYNEWKSKSHPEDQKRVITLVNDDPPAQPWIDKFKAIEAYIASQPKQDYAALPTDGLHLWGGATANSNTWTHYLLQKAGLLGLFNHAVNKLTGNDLPWAPGWNIAVPYNDAPHP